MNWSSERTTERYVDCKTGTIFTWSMDYWYGAREERVV